MEEKNTEEILAEINQLTSELEYLILNFDKFVVPEAKDRGIEEISKQELDMELSKSYLENIKSEEFYIEFSKDIKKDISKIKNDVKNTGKKAIKGAKTLTNLARNKVNKGILDLRKATKRVISNGARKGKEFIENKVDGAKEWMGDKIDSASDTVSEIKDNVERVGKTAVGLGVLGAIKATNMAKRGIKGAKTLNAKLNRKVLGLRIGSKRAIIEGVTKGKEFIDDKVEDAKEWFGEKKEVATATMEVIKDGIGDKFEEASLRFQKRKNQTILSTLKMVKSASKKLEEVLEERIATKEELNKKIEQKQPEQKKSIKPNMMEL